MKKYIALFSLATFVLGVALLVWPNPGGDWEVCVYVNCRTPQAAPESGWTPHCKKIVDPSTQCTSTCPDTRDTSGCVFWDVDLSGSCAADSYTVWATKGVAVTDTDRIHWDDPGAVLCAPGGP
ncbi:MAG: hypothetical protein ACE5JA_09185 [bacterium]